jgi:site-specific DNA-cytosine methylase
VRRAGSLFSGSGMLDVAVHEVLGAKPAWFVENDPAASSVLAYHWPDVPNLGDPPLLTALCSMRMAATSVSGNGSVR